MRGTGAVMYTDAIVRKPGNAFINGLTTSGLGKPDLSLALEQHRTYVAALEHCGLRVTVLEADERFPDSTFVEDTAILTGRFAVMTNPGAESRNGEKDAIRPEIEKFYSSIEEINQPGTLDGGDVMEINGHYYIGITDRTNADGARRLTAVLKRNGRTGSTVPLKSFLHLKTGVSWIGGGDLLAAGELIDNPAFRDFNIIPVSPDEAYAANCIRVNDYLIIPAGFKKTGQALRRRGYRLLEVEMSEFQKMDGGVSCLSLRFRSALI